MAEPILVLNAGSSSIKFAAYDRHSGASLARGAVSGMGTHRPVLEIDDTLPLRPDVARPVPDLTNGDMLDHLLGRLREVLPEVAAVGHRIVHGGRDYTAPVVVDDTVLEVLHRLVPLAPLHEPHNLHGVIAARRAWPGAVQVGCFDTAFHRTQPEVAQRFAIPGALHDDGIQRYGFHGLSYQYIAEILPDHIGDTAKGRVIVAHLGSGASLCAMIGGKSVATTMGMSALDGLMMGTRSGSIDPGAVLHLMQQRNKGAVEIRDLLYRESGLKGVSGISGDLRLLESSDDPRAELAQALFAFRARQAIGAMAASIGGLDAFVFTGGIGEHSVAMRARICEGMEWLGLTLDPEANRRNATRLGIPDARVQVLTLPTDEECMIFAAAVSKLD